MWKKYAWEGLNWNLRYSLWSIENQKFGKWNIFVACQIIIACSVNMIIFNKKLTTLQLEVLIPLLSFLLVPWPPHPLSPPFMALPSHLHCLMVPFQLAMLCCRFSCLFSFFLVLLVCEFLKGTPLGLLGILGFACLLIGQTIWSNILQIAIPFEFL